MPTPHDCGSSEPATHRRSKGDRRTAIGALLNQGGAPVDLTGLTVKVAVDYANGEALVEPTETGVFVQRSFNVTPDPGTGKWIENATIVQEGDQLVLSSTGTLPGGFATSTRYFATDVRQNSFKLANEDGQPIGMSDPGSGTMSYKIIGTVQWTPTAAAVAELGKFYLWWIVYSEDGAPGYFPIGKNFILEIVPGPE